MPVKVAHIITLLELGGAQQNTLHTVKNLDRSRFSPLLICGRGAMLDDEARDVSAPIFHVPEMVRPVRPLADAAVLRRLTAILRRERPDIVHTHSSKAGVLGRLAAALAGVRVVVHTFHGFGFTPGQPFPVRALFIGMEKMLAPLTTAFICVSRANLEEAVSRGFGPREKYHLIRSGVSLGRYREVRPSRDPLPGLDIPAASPLVVTIGPFKPQKNLGDFLEAAALVARRRPDARFLVVGDGEGRPELERRLSSLGLQGVVFLGGWRRDIPAVLRRADVFVMTSLWEGLPRALVEAMAAGVPPVVNAVDGTRDLVRDGENGSLVPPRRPDVTAARILSLLGDPGEAARQGAAARVSIDDSFDIDGMVRGQEALYEALLSTGTKTGSPHKL